ncbi:MAG: OmpA family protein, partial [Myxococcales bacterium]|nr:OmpA family protein [Myxococcales bacterium]
KDRMMSQGYGFYCVLDAGTTEEAHEKNRRVEFKILQRAGKNTDIARGCENASKHGVVLKKIPAPKPMPTATPDTSAKTDTKAAGKGFGAKK